MTPTPEQHLFELETKFWRAIQDHDVETAIALTEDPCVVTGPTGVGMFDHQRIDAMMHDSHFALKDVRLTDPQVRMLADDIGIVAYRVTEQVTVDGQPFTVEAAESSTWVRRDGEWRCALHSEALQGDAYGRDRGRVKSATTAKNSSKRFQG